MIRHVIKIKNISKTPRSIRPYQNRDSLVTFGIGETKEIDVMQGTWEVRKNPAAYFKYLGFSVVTAPPIPQRETAQKVEPKKDNITPVAPVAPVQAPPKPIQEPPKPVTPVNTQQPLSVATVPIVLGSGDFRHYNPLTSQWQGLRKVRDWIIGRIIFESAKGAYYRVSDLDSEQMLCESLTETEAVTITKLKAN